MDQLHAVQDAEVGQQSLDHLALGDDADRGVELVLTAAEPVRVAAGAASCSHTSTDRPALASSAAALTPPRPLPTITTS